MILCVCPIYACSQILFLARQSFNGDKKVISWQRHIQLRLTVCSVEEKAWIGPTKTIGDTSGGDYKTSIREKFRSGGRWNGRATSISQACRLRRCSNRQDKASGSHFSARCRRWIKHCCPSRGAGLLRNAAIDQYPAKFCA